MMPAPVPSADLLPPILERYWGYTRFRPLQREAMDAVLHGRDSLLVLPTGGGKSLCFQAPALVREGLALVISPLISLMKDQVDTLVANGVAGGVPEQRDGRGRPHRGDGRPEGRALSPAVCRARAHRWARAAAGSPGCSAPARSASSPSTRPTASATGATTSGPSTGSSARCAPSSRRSASTPSPRRRPSRVRHDIVQQLGLRDAVTLVGSFDRPNLPVPRLAAHLAARRRFCRCSRATGEAGIIYCPTRRDVDDLAGWLADEGLRARPYHAGLSDEERHAQPGRLPERVGGHRRRHGGLRHGHRPLRRPVRDSRRCAAVARALPAGSRPRRPRRPGGRVRADRVGGRLPAVARDPQQER